MKAKTLRGLLSKTTLLILILLISSSCGKGDKEIISHYENGNPKLIYFIKTEDATRYKVAEEMYYENGNLRYKGSFKDNKRTGKWLYYFENANKFSEFDYTNSESGKGIEVYKIDNTKIVDKKDEVKEVTYFPDGSLAIIKVKYEGFEKEYKFFPSYNLMEERRLEGNILNGRTESYYENGSINSINYFKDGMQDSLYVLYYKNGLVQVKGMYNMDLEVGKWEYFKEDGTEDGQELYSDDGSIIQSRDTGVRYFGKDGKEINL